jgi:hypothetical protein
MRPPDGSLLLTLGFVATSLGMIAVVAALVARAHNRTAGAGFAAAATAWAVFNYMLADAGALAVFTLPPRMFFVFGLGLIAVAVIVLSSWGRALARLPWSVLLGVQAFRILVELLIHRAVTEGIAPPQMTWSGYNLDIVTGVTALPVAALAARDALPRWAIAAWNALGVALLGVVLVVAILSMPTPFQRVTPDNTWVAFAPWVWLPTILVCCALLLHGLCVRKLMTAE